jgi:ABC transporter DrrB family efflux protein
MSAAGRLTQTIGDVGTMTRRNLYRYPRVPTLLAVSTVQPVMFVLLFTYAFGGAIHIPGTRYIDYLFPGTLVLALTFGSTQTGVALAEDIATGMIDRFRSLPIDRVTILAGRTLAEAVRNIFVVGVMVAVGSLVGFRFHAGPWAALATVGLALAVGFAMSWTAAFIGLSVRDAETAQVATLLAAVPLIFTSSTFVPIATMPGWLQAFANINPITKTVDALRVLSLGGATRRPALEAAAWIVGTLAVFIPLSVHRFGRMTR